MTKIFDVMLLLYQGYKDGGDQDDFLPHKWWPEGTRSSYEMRVFRGGVDRGIVEVRNLNVMQLANEIRSVCNDAGESEL